MFNDLMSGLDDVIQETFSLRGLLNNQYVIDVVIDKDVLRVNSYGETVTNAYEITFFNAQSTALKEGDIVEVFGDSQRLDGRYSLLSPVSGDSGVTIWAANVA